MSMKRILGTMLATRMAGRGRRRGALGTASALGLMGSRRRRSRMGGKLGLAALGYMAYQAYQDNQSRQSAQQGGQGGAQRAGGSGGGLMDNLRNAANQILGGGAGAAARPSTSTADDPDLREGEAAAEKFSEDEALLMIRAMITAAYSDGSLSQDERSRILQAIDEADASPEERATMEREIANPKPLETLLAQVNDEETADQFYIASRAALDGEGEADRRYLAELRAKLNLSEGDAAEAETIAS